MTDPFTDQTRAERAFESYFAEHAAGEEFPPLDPATLTGPDRRRWRPALFGAAAVVAVIAVAVAVIRPFGIGGSATPSVVPAVPAAPGDLGVWQKTSPIPIGQRYGSVNLWVDGAFYLIGGISHCGLDAQGNPLNDAICPASLPSPGESLADGARYDPATGTWTGIADAPVVIGEGSGVVVGGAIYVVTEDRGADWPTPVVLRYDPAADTWTQLPQPSDPAEKKVRHLLTRDGELYASTVVTGCLDDDCFSIDRWDESTSSWHQYAGEDAALRFEEGWLASTTDGFVSLYRTPDWSVTAAAVFTDGWHELPAGPFNDPAWLGAVGDVVVAVAWDGRAYTLDLADPAWQRLSEPPYGPGGLAGADADVGQVRLVDGTHVVVRGQLYNPATGAWTDVPPLPNPDWTTGSFASNGSQVLGCFVGPTGSMNDCYLLTLAAPSATAPPAAVDGWTATADTPLTPRVEALATHVGDEFVVIGGRQCADVSVDLSVDETVSCEGGWTSASDGAAYNPATDRWRTIAQLPVELDAYESWAVLDQTLYVISSWQEGFWAYDAAADSWRELPTPPGGGHGGVGPSQLLATGQVLLALAESHLPDSWFDPSTGEWTELPAATYPNDVYPNEAQRLAAFTGKELLIGEPGLTDDTENLVFTFSVFGHDDSGRLFTRPSTRVPGTLEDTGRLVVNSAATTVLVPWEGGTAAYRVGGGEEWIAVPAPGQDRGPLESGLVAGGLVSLQGHLFDPETGSWRYVPDLPDGSSAAAIQAAGSDALLSCFTLVDPTGLGERCYLLRR